MYGELLLHTYGKFQRDEFLQSKNDATDRNFVNIYIHEHFRSYGEILHNSFLFTDWYLRTRFDAGKQ